MVHLFSNGAHFLIWIVFELAGAFVAAQAYQFMTRDEKMGALAGEFMGTFFLCVTVSFAISAKISAYTTLAAATALAPLASDTRSYEASS